MVHTIKIFCTCGYRTQINFPKFKHREEILGRAQCSRRGRVGQQDMIVVRDECPHWMVDGNRRNLK